MISLKCCYCHINPVNLSALITQSDHTVTKQKGTHPALELRIDPAEPPSRLKPIQTLYDMADLI